MAQIYLLRYNNYYNRIVKHIDDVDIDKLIEDGATICHTANNINFKWGDGVNQEVILNYDAENLASPDYALITDSQKNTVWFVLEMSRLRNGQFRFLLYRDLINTHYNDIIKAPCFIEKATVDKNNDLIFNSENMTYNQIKKEEHELMDETMSAWIVGYLKTGAGQKNDTFTTSQGAGEVDMSSQNFSDWKDEYCDKEYLVNEEALRFYLDDKVTEGWFGQNVAYGQIWFNYNNATLKQVDASDVKGRCYVMGQSALADVTYGQQAGSIWYKNDLLSKTRSTFSYENKTKYNEAMGWVGKIVRFKDKIIKITGVNTTFNNEQAIQLTNSSTLGAYLVERLRYYVVDVKRYPSSEVGVTNTSYSKGPFTAVVQTETINSFSYDELPESATYNWSIAAGTKSLRDAPYKMFCIPYSDNLEVKVTNTLGSTSSALTLKPNKETALWWAISIAKAYGSGDTGNLIDLQILPYCPINCIQEDWHKIHVGSVTENIDAAYLYKGNTYMNIALFCDYSNFKKEVSSMEAIVVTPGKPIPKSYTEVRDYKIESETEVYRICSPNYNGVFEFNNAKNDGCSKFYTECTYKPYNPFICVHPQWKRMYGRDFADNRGLICGGDFSLPLVTDRWVEYELSNKNYQQIFDRQIKNMEVNNSIALDQAKVQAALGNVTGALMGAAAGGIAGGGNSYLSAAMAGAGGAAGYNAADWAGKEDIKNLKRQQAETLDYTRDLYGFQLGNIKALPYGLARVSSLVVNNKFFPFVEVYRATDQEIQALKNKIKYNGMSIGIIDKIENYIKVESKNYIKGKIIRFDDMDVDYHESNTIAEELNKGVFI